MVPLRKGVSNVVWHSKKELAIPSVPEEVGAAAG